MQFDQNQVSLYVGETGSGKTTQSVPISPREPSNGLTKGTCYHQDTPIHVLQQPATPQGEDGCLYTTQTNRRYICSRTRC